MNRGANLLFGLPKEKLPCMWHKEYEEKCSLYPGWKAEEPYEGQKKDDSEDFDEGALVEILEEMEQTIVLEKK